MAKISILVAGAMLMLHTFLPHSHHTEPTVDEHIVEHESAKSMIDYILLAFHLDQGEGHLESYEIVNTLQLNFVAVVTEIQPIDFELNVYDAPEVVHTIYQDDFSERLSISELRFRGPPQG